MAACKVCDAEIAEDPLDCVGCGATYHRSCRLGAGRCLTEGCKRGKGLAPSKQAEQNDSALQMNAFPVVFGFFVGLAIGVPLAGLMKLPLLAAGALVLVIGVIAAGVAHQLWG